MAVGAKAVQEVGAVRHCLKRFMDSLPSHFTPSDFALAQIQDAAIRIAEAGGAINRRLMIDRLEVLLWGESLTPRHYRIWPGIVKNPEKLWAPTCAGSGDMVFEIMGHLEEDPKILIKEIEAISLTQP